MFVIIVWKLNIMLAWLTRIKLARQKKFSLTRRNEASRNIFGSITRVYFQLNVHKNRYIHLAFTQTIRFQPGGKYFFFVWTYEFDIFSLWKKENKYRGGTSDATTSSTLILSDYSRDLADALLIVTLFKVF